MAHQTAAAKRGILKNTRRHNLGRQKRRRRRRDAAQQALFNTTATTIQGLLACLAYVRDNAHLTECVWAGADDALRLVTTIERAFYRTNGLPEPPPWFDNEES
jgi:hypothetical protein